MMNYVDDYLYNILTKQLKEFEISDEICNEVISNIKQQMLSLLRYWDDIKFRNTILAVGSEEGLFYKPNAKNEVRCFIVVTVRNSLFETLASEDYSKLGAVKMIDDDKVLQVTSRAIEYFSVVDFNSLSKTLDFTGVYDIYAEIKEKYSVAWNAMEQIGNSNKKCIRYNKKVAELEPELLNMINQEDIVTEQKNCKVVLSGYDDGIDENLTVMLKNAYEEPGFVLVVSCFKMITRNIKKLFRIIDFILKCDGAVVTANYYITNGYVEVRRPLIKAAHGTKEAERNLDNLNGLASKHADILKRRPRMKFD